ncbi:SipW-dependent-type signal peptide-containing protein [Methanosarcina horonobensis]|uniref:SipW-dependent-type signal peptide-containing protein n=1 Tax=Methanosarcina horonobensis TaxID=418008 RepID=UPI000AB5734C|nr:SipW-dependent-type signal peptide-containing protein [Methanosarcina horonobensis]
MLFASFLSLNGIWTSTIGTFAYFSDMEQSTGNTLTAGVWESGAASTGSSQALPDNKVPSETPDETSDENSTEAPDENSTETTAVVPAGNEADSLTISDSKLIENTENNEKFNGITFNISGTWGVTIDKTQAWWNVPQGNTSRITEITIEGREFFSGNNSSGEIIDGSDHLLEANSIAKVKIYFDGDVSEIAPFTINITMEDESVKSFVTDPE